jgi:Transposase, Mutator family
MLVLETSIQLEVKVGAEAVTINDLAAALPEVVRAAGERIASEALEQAQEAHLARVYSGAAELVCERCGLVMSGSGCVLRRGSRPRKLRASIGVIRFSLLQLTCRGCRRTWSPFPELMGLRPRQRISEELERKLVEAVTNQSYEKTCRLAGEWLGSSVSTRTLHRSVQARGSQVVFTPAPECRTAVADGTKVPAEKPRYGTDVRVAFQILGRERKHGRTVVKKRIAGWSVGPGGWEQTLPAGIASEVIVTDRESGIPEVLRKQHPGIRHQLCEWHLGHTANHLMTLDKVPVAERRKIVAELNAILWEHGEERRERYIAFCDRLTRSRRTQSMLRDSLDRVLYETPSATRTTSFAEREMREINRRTDVGVQWSLPGVDHMLRLRHALRLNPDDFERVWSPVRPVTFHVVPQA